MTVYKLYCNVCTCAYISVCLCLPLICVWICMYVLCLCAVYIGVYIVYNLCVDYNYLFYVLV